jgi:hypothetical protein
LLGGELRLLVVGKFSCDISTCCGAMTLPLLLKCRLVAVASKRRETNVRGSWQSLGKQSVSRQCEQCQVVASWRGIWRSICRGTIDFGRTERFAAMPREALQIRRS